MAIRAGDRCDHRCESTEQISASIALVGYIEHRDLVGLNVEQLQGSGGAMVHAEVGDARDLNLPDSSVDAVVLLGPLYYLRERAHRVPALREACRIVRPGGPVFAAVISRWAPRLDGVVPSGCTRAIRMC
jgi:SAM-dependent methyltransferase